MEATRYRVTVDGKALAETYRTLKAAKRWAEQTANIYASASQWPVITVEPA